MNADERDRRPHPRFLRILFGVIPAQAGIVRVQA
jgi:hypothetical protein